jgi:G:T-mismatch repair DNA endonuclease (very short patch repair protein)
MPRGVYERTPAYKTHLTKQILRVRARIKYRPRTEEEKLAISIGTKKELEGKPAWNKGLTKQTDERVAKYAAKNKGRIISQELRTRISASVKANPTKYWQGKRRSEETKQKIRERRATQKALPRQDTKPELLVRDELRRINIEDIPQFRLTFISKRSKADFFLYHHNILLFIDGDFIHANPALYPDDYIIWPSKNITALQIRKRDEKINNALREKNYIVIRLWESDILHDAKTTVESALNLYI